MYSANISDSVSATTRYLLVGLKDDDYPHKATNYLIIKRLSWTLQTIGAGSRWRIKFGVVIENDDTDGSVIWFIHQDISGAGILTGDQDYQHSEQSAGDGFSLIADAGILRDIVTNQKTIDSAAYANNVADFRDATGATTKSPNIGDLIVELENVNSSGSVVFDTNAGYFGR